jgi:ferredoxin
MKVAVDPELCSQCGLCVELAPDVFEMGDDSAVVLVEIVPPDLEDDATEAAESCPEEAISIAK